MSKTIRRFREGDKIPENATLIRTEFEKGRYLGERCVATWGIFPFNGGTYADVYEKIPVYVYEVSTDPAAKVGE